jgi:hypothetical protein
MKKIFLFIALCCAYAVVLQSQTTITVADDKAITATVAATKMNVLYVGLDNPISVAVPGIANDKVSISISGGNIVSKGNGNYFITVPSEIISKTVDINVFYTNESGQKLSAGSYSFRVMGVPVPRSYIVGASSSGPTLKGELVSVGKVIAYLEGFAFEGVGFTVDSYTITQSSSAKTIQVKGNLFTQEVKDLINSCKSGDKLYFDDIKASGLGNTYKLSSVIVVIE